MTSECRIPPVAHGAPGLACLPSATTSSTSTPSGDVPGRERGQRRCARAATGSAGGLPRSRGYRPRRRNRAARTSLRAVDTSLTRIVDGPNAAAEIHVVDGNRVFGQANAGVSVFELTPDDLAAASTYDVVHTGECSNIEGQLGQLAHDATSRLSFDFSERPWEYVQQYAPSASVAIWSAPSGDLAPGQATDRASTSPWTRDCGRHLGSGRRDGTAGRSDVLPGPGA